MSFRGKITAAFVACMLVGCASKPVPINYAPSSVLSAQGAVQVANFGYQPARNGAVKPNQVRNTALGNILFEKDVSTIMRDAVFAELRFVGVGVGGNGNVLTGDVEEFLIDDLGYSVDWTLRVHYTVKDASGKVVYDAVKNTQRNTSKFANVFGALNETIKLNVEDIIKDPKFIGAING